MSWLRTEAAEVADALQEVHVQLRILQRNLGEQAQKAPFKLVTDRLEQLGEVEEKSITAVAERLSSLGRHPDEAPDDHPFAGRNCWERLVALQEAYRTLVRQLKFLTVRWEDEHPEDAALLGTVRDRALVNRSVVGDLVARSDPHALN